MHLVTSKAKKSEDREYLFFCTQISVHSILFVLPVKVEGTRKTQKRNAFFEVNFLLLKERVMKV